MADTPSLRQRSARLLEFPQLLSEVAGYCSLEPARAEILALNPLTDRESLDRLWAWVGELMELLAEDDDLALGGVAELESILGKDRPFPGPLGGEELAGIGAACLELSRLLGHVRENRRRLPRSEEHLARSEDPAALGDRLSACLYPDGRLKDTASPKLASLRRSVAVAESRLRELAQELMGKAVQQGWASADQLALRGDRYCVPLKSGRRAELAGVIHDRSATGATLFVEPLAVVEGSNQLQEAKLAVADEESRILAALNGAVAERAPELLDLYRRAVVLDGLRARARWGHRRRALVPRLEAPGGRLWLPGLRHPLLESQLEAAGELDHLVPLELDLSGGDIVLLVSGPNAGGKTVALKAVGLASLMAQCGIPLPTRQAAHVPVHDQVLIELGDDQSIADALSHFSAHVSHLRDIHESATRQSLVLLDEVGGGTDPVEGVALARAYLEALAATAGRVLATTHYGQLKALATESDAFRNASMAYDGAALLPLFQLQLDLPGASRALEIAERMGLDAAILAAARERVGDESLRLDEVLRQMEEERSAFAGAREQAEADRDGLAAERRRYEEMAGELRRQRREKLNAADQEAEGIVRKARARIERLLADIQEAGGDAAEAAAVARAEVDETASRLAERQQARRREPAAARPARLELDARARHSTLGVVGRIVELSGDRVTLELAGGRRLVARASELLAPEGEPASADGPGGRGGGAGGGSTGSGGGGVPGWPGRDLGGGVRTELDDGEGYSVSRIDVRGHDAEDAWLAVDKALDRCVLAGTTHLEVIHGKGSGTLRRVVGQRLARDSRVAEATLGDGRSGDDGLTVVRLH